MVAINRVLEIERRVEELISSSGNANDSFDLMVIGAGSAGFAAAIKAAELGYRVAIVESGTIGGTCVNLGCVPSKTLLRATDIFHTAVNHPFQGVEIAARRFDWSRVVAQKDRLVEEMRQSKYIDVLAAYPQVTYLRGRARFVGANQVEIAGKNYTPHKIVIASGARSWAPPIPGLQAAGYLTSDSAMQLQELPASMIVLGANAVGLELAQMFSRAGVSITLLELLPRIAPFEDQEISFALHSYLEAEGMQILTGFRTSQIEKRDGVYLISGSRQDEELVIEAEGLLVATGRRPNTQEMGLEAAGVNLGKVGEILVNDTLQTSNQDIYAAGDVTGQDMYVYAAAYGGSLAAENSLTAAGRVYEAAYIPRVTFTSPQIASAGLTEDQARQEGYHVRLSSLPMTQVPRALAAHDTRGLIKLVADENTDQLLGAQILAPEAGEMIQTAVLAMRFGITLTQLRETMFPYLTSVEGLKLAAVAFEKDVSLLSCCAG